MMLALIATFATSAVLVSTTGGCPSEEAIAGQLDRLGASSALARIGTAEVSLIGASMHVVMRDRRGLTLGGRDVDAPADCGGRAALAAVLIAAWTGDLMKTNLGAVDEISPPDPPSAMVGLATLPALPLVEGGARTVRPLGNESVRAVNGPAAATSAPNLAPVSPKAGLDVTPAPPEPSAVMTSAAAGANPTAPGPAASVVAAVATARSVGIDLAAAGFGIHDGDAGTYGVSLQGTIRASWLCLVALAETTGDRRRALGPAEAEYSLARLGLGLGWRKQWAGAFADVAVVPELARYVMQGTGAELTQARRVAAWGVLLDGRLRVGWSLGTFAPFVFTGVSWSLLRETLSLDNRPESVSLARANLAAGLGISVLLR